MSDYQFGVYEEARSDERKLERLRSKRKKIPGRDGVYADTVSSTSGASVGAVVQCSGMYISSVSYSYPTDGAATESVTLVSLTTSHRSSLSSVR